MIPIILVPAGLSALWGAYKSYKAHQTNKKAKETTRRAKRVASSARSALKSARTEAQSSLEHLGKLKLQVWRDQMGRFVDVFGRIRNVELSDIEGIGDAEPLSITEGQLAQMRELSGYASEALSGGAAGLGAGALVGVASYGGAMMFASASTGTAIATLSGAAATNATLAFFGGGSLAAGGMGMAGGAMVLGGLVAGPALAVFGFMMAAAADKNLARARQNLAKARHAASEMRVAQTAIEGVARMASSFSDILTKFTDAFGTALDQLEGVIDRCGKDYRKYDEADRKKVFLAVQFAQTTKHLLETPLLTKTGKPRKTPCNKVLAEGEALLALPQ